MRAKRSVASSQESLLWRYGKKKQPHISETKHFRHMVHRRKNVCFHPLNPFPSWTGPARPWRSFNANNSVNINLSEKYYQTKKFANLHKIYVSKFGIDSFLSIWDTARIMKVGFFKFFRYISGCIRNFQNPKTASESSSKMLSNRWILFWKFLNFNPKICKKHDFWVFFTCVFRFFDMKK